MPSIAGVAGDVQQLGTWESSPAGARRILLGAPQRGDALHGALALRRRVDQRPSANPQDLLTLVIERDAQFNLQPTDEVVLGRGETGGH